MHVIVYASVCEFRGRNYVEGGGEGGGGGGRCKTREIFNFSKKGQNGNYCNSAGGKPEIFLDLGLQNGLHR